jgi:hypothetical protein
LGTTIYRQVKPVGDSCKISCVKDASVISGNGMFQNRKRDDLLLFEKLG